jgi:foldase protein PrsA
MENSGKRAARIALLAILLIASLTMTGCGKRLVMTRGYGKQELFRIGNTNCTLPEYNVFLINLQKHCERTFGREVWESGEGDELKEAIEQRALSEASRLKVMLLLAVQDNIMLTDAEETLADEAQTEYYESMSEEERLKLLSSDGMLVKRPILIGEGFVLVGFKEIEGKEKIF